VQQLLCPQCGASVRFESPGAVMVVCAACRSTLTRDAQAARRIGHMADLVEDGSVVQLGTRGRAGQLGFHVLGRLRLRYDAGAWNEWYIAFDDGTYGWLSDADAHYAVTRRDESIDSAQLLPFEELRAGGPVKLAGLLYTVSDIRPRCHCIGGEGELPLQAGDGWDARVVDARRESSFVTIDYSDDAPVVYSGTAGEIEFDAGTLRTKEDIADSTGRYRGQMLPLDCPNCAGTVNIAVAMATQVVCPSCSSLLDCSGDRAEIIEANRRVARFTTTIPMGARGKIGAVEYDVIGIMRCDVPDAAGEPDWTEYLLFNPQRGYLWLVQTQEGWQSVTVCDAWPAVTNDASARWGNRTWTRRYAYASRVEQVFGAFNWRVQRGDTSQIVDFACNNDMLTREQSGDEVVWLHAVRISATTVARAFGLPTPRQTLPTRAEADPETDDEAGELITIGVVATMLLFILSEEISAVAMFFGIALVWLPLWMTGQITSFLQGEAAED